MNCKKINILVDSQIKAYQDKQSQKSIVIYVIVTCLLSLILLAIPLIARADNLKASYYSTTSLIKEGTYRYSKGIMANGQRFDENALTCACRLYPLGSVLLVTNLENGKSVVVKVTDRIGKRFANSRIDLSKRAFMEIADLKKGLVSIKVKRIS